MWRRCLVRHLGWEQYGFAQKKFPTHSYKSPGWSWITNPGPTIVHATYLEHAKVISCAITLADDRYPFGEVKSGQLVLKALTLPAPLEDETVLYSMDIGPSGKRRPKGNNCLLLLGYAVNKSFIALVVERQNDGFYIRIGKALGTYGSDLWSAEDAEMQQITII